MRQPNGFPSGARNGNGYRSPNGSGPGQRSFEDPFDGMQITWKDGLPDDPSERATIESTLIAAGLTSKYSAIKRLLDGDDEAAEAEMERIEKEQQKQMMDSALMGGGTTPPGDDLAASAQVLTKLKQHQENGQGETGKPKDEGGSNGATTSKR